MPYVSVAIGGCLGAWLRFFISEWLGTVQGFPFATLCINLSGSFFLAWFYTFTLERFPIHPHLRLGIGTGFVGAFTTFSTLTVETWKLVQSKAYGFAVTYVLASFFGGLLLAWIGYHVAARMTRLNYDPFEGEA